MLKGAVVVVVAVAVAVVVAGSRAHTSTVMNATRQARPQCAEGTRPRCKSAQPPLAACSSLGRIWRSTCEHHLSIVGPAGLEWVCESCP